MLSTPVIAGIKQLHPESELWLMTTPQARELVRHDPLVAGVLTFDKRSGDGGIVGLLGKARELREQGFSRAYSVHRSFRSALLLWLARIPCRVGFADAGFSFLYHTRVFRDPARHDVLRRLAVLSPEIDLSLLPQDLRLFSIQLADARPPIRDFIMHPGRYVMLAPGSVWPTKRWDKQGYRDLAQALITHGLRVALVGSAEEKPLCDEIGAGVACSNFAGMSSLGELLLLVKNSSLMVSNDSLAQHLASAFKVPLVVIFCATSPAFGCGPWRTRSIVVERKGLTCKPCAPHGGMRCPTGTEACMREVPCKDVLKAALELLEKPK